MSYIDKNLLIQEQVIYRSHTHWIIFVSCVFWLILGLVLLQLPSILSFMGVFCFIFMVYDGSLSLIRFYASEFAVTNKRILAKIGFIQRQAVEIFLQKVEGVQVEQSIMGRIFNFGTVIIIGTGGSRDRFATIEDPLAFRKAVQEQIERVLSEQKVNTDK